MHQLLFSEGSIDRRNPTKLQIAGMRSHASPPNDRVLQREDPLESFLTLSVRIDQRLKLH
jgi:hypothetical protein